MYLVLYHCIGFGVFFVLVMFYSAVSSVSLLLFDFCLLMLLLLFSHSTGCSAVRVLVSCSSSRASISNSISVFPAHSTSFVSEFSPNLKRPFSMSSGSDFDCVSPRFDFFSLTGCQL